MLKQWLTQLGDSLSGSAPADTADDREHTLRVATAALMVEVARADHSFDPQERAALLRLVAERFGLTGDDTAALTDDAALAASESVSVYGFAQRLHESLSEAEKSTVVDLLWQVAYADGRLDKYENALVLKISDLMYVPRGQVMRLKHDAAVAAGATPAEQKL